ncbi:SGNH hydrolase-like domain-containing protein, acetyltransferase AlgX [Paucidesulfovibrio gracilis DSM 16080]|uniref:SGNH hydrolase-like domain-containing protein, acetyltransferase AlgX n=1 Tax=Paucidesulfovibrio gracilis DSM 16080 TaxID=1121449 RepID=A0A1T4Y5K4_9BACT|nr:hypothetical protein [Paucidesulfovibrio gracilis]SKA96565.1 SGNH hydrolase-like domain-containing protein, acetyltransferase AlgX [Paucidesulfovibrio gracilis DSM 16080]
MVVSKTKARVGKNGFLFLCNDNNKVYRQISGEYNLTPLEVARWKAEIDYRFDACRSVGAQYLYLIVPNKHCVYSQYLDDEHVVSEKRIARKLEKASPHVLYPSNMLKEYDELTYYRTDTHWSSVGCAVVWNEIAEKLRLGTALDIAKTKQVTMVGDLGNKLSPQRTSIAVELDIETETVETWNNGLHNRGFISIHTNRNSNLKRAIIFGDSFTANHIKYISAYFSELYFVNSNLFPLDLIKKLAPDVVITQTVERFIHKTVPTDRNVFRSLLCLMEEGKYCREHLYRFMQKSENRIYPTEIFQEMRRVAEDQITFLDTVEQSGLATFLESKKGEVPCDLSKYINARSPSRLHYEQYLYYKHVGDGDNAIKEIADAAEKFPHRPKYVHSYAKELDKCGKLEAAAEQMNSAILLRPQNLDYHLYLISLFLKSGKIQSAKEAFGNAKALFPDLEEPHHLWCMSYLSVGEMGSAVVESARMIKQHANPKTHLQVATLFMQHANFEHAKRHALVALQRKPADAEAQAVLRRIVGLKCRLGQANTQRIA